ncbi:MAG: transposase, partial [Planctomycetota bacterium]|nr:transposase [Planctomycetota bacterium]
SVPPKRDATLGSRFAAIAHTLKGLHRPVLKGTETMPQSLARIHVHIVFSTKNRGRLLSDRKARNETHAYMASILQSYDSPPVLIGGADDHAHILCALSKNHALAKVIGETKRCSSKWIKTRGREYSLFQWQNGYGAFSVSESMVARVRDYIANQEGHHLKMSFQDEFRGLLRRDGIEFDERYVWD